MGEKSNRHHEKMPDMKCIRGTVYFSVMTCFLCLNRLLLELCHAEENYPTPPDGAIVYSQTFSKAYRHETSSLGYNANILLFHNVTGRNPAVDIKAKSIKLNMAACDSVYRFPASNHQRLSLILLSPSSINASPTYQLSTHSFGKT